MHVLFVGHCIISLHHIIASLCQNQGIIGKYSRGSAQHVVALQLIDSVVASLIENFSTMYSGRLLTEIVLIGDRAIASNEFVADLKNFLQQVKTLDLFG